MNYNLFHNEPVLTLENGIGLLLSILIIFDLKLEQPIADLLNTPLGIVVSLLVFIVFLIYMNPIVAILFIIYLYETIQLSSNMMITTKKRNNDLVKMNQPMDTMLEEKVIQARAPIVNKNKHMNVSFKPYEEDSLNMHPY
jgi:c-di-AMP phosphodiesterase-like protein|tara:strand:- start:881 stop:1300 length:420 start_codon:yes stop_codon:yes gene_type:complete